MPNGVSASRAVRNVPSWLLIAVAGLTWSCGRPGELSDAARPGGARSGAGDGISASLNALESGQSRPAPVSADANIDTRTGEMLALMEQAQLHGDVSVDPPAPEAAPQETADLGPSPEANPGVSFSLPAEPDITVRVPESALGTGVDESLLPAAPIENEQSKRQRLLGELAAMLHHEAELAAAPAPTLAQIAALRFLQLPPTRTIVTSENPGAVLGGADAPLPETPARLNSPNDPLADYLQSVTLSPSERDMLDAWSDFVFHARSALLQHPDLTAIASPAQDLADALGAWKSLSIDQAKLCSKVEGFGVYTELRQFGGVNKFLASRPARMIVYLEPSNFQHTSVSRDGVWGEEVRLIQDLRLYHAAKETDTLVWRKPDQEIVDFSRNKRRDFFVVQVIELPETLGVGSYRLKVILSDKANGAVAESLIPLEIVADVSALRD